MALRCLAALMLLAMTMAGCAAHRTPPPHDRYIVPYSLPGSDELCIEQADRWSCIHLEDLRKLLKSMGAA